jgi:hypothetical protein
MEMSMRIARIAKLCLGLVLLASSVTALHAQASKAPANETATAFYQRYLAAFEKATKIEDVLPFMSAEHVKQVNDTPAGQRAEMFGLIKMMTGMNTDVKVTKETATPTGATLTLTGVGMDKKPIKGTADLVKEGGVWKVDTETWNN